MLVAHRGYFPIPPVKEKTRGVKEPCSTSQTLCLVHSFLSILVLSVAGGFEGA